MTYSWSFKTNFAAEFARYPKDQQDKILDFIGLYEANGLSDFSVYNGKISPSWTNLDSKDNSFIFAKSNSLWHYHIGLPEYHSKHSKYNTSDWVLHFQWENKGSHIDIIDICYHYKYDGTFYLPDESYLK